jgi:hypothetical protein
MRRVQFIELHEQPWFPQSIRDEVTDMLQFGLNLSGAYASVAPLLEKALQVTGNRFVVDLCSGGGGPWVGLSRKLQENPRLFGICLTDKYPNIQAFEDAGRISENITFCPEPVDATNVPTDLPGFRTMFTSFHHFRREQALAILRNSVAARQGIGIFEITRRSAPTIALMFLWALAAFIFTPFIYPFRWTRLLWTYAIPIIPFVLLFDGVVSCLRTYRPVELNELTDELMEDGYHWETGEYGGGTLKVPITYLIGFPLAREVCAMHQSVSAANC